MIQRMVGVAMVVVLLAGCSRKPAQLLVGSWTKDGFPDSTMEFFEDGTFSMASKNEIPIVGKWTILGDGRLKMEFTMFGVSTMVTSKLAFDGDKLTMTNEKGQEEKLVRAKAK